MKIMNRKAFLSIILFLITFQASAQKSQLRIARNTIGKLQAAIVAKADVNSQINIVGEGLKATISAQQDRKTKKYPETWAIAAYLNSYLALIDTKDPDKYYQDALALIDTAKQLDRFHENEKLLNAAVMNTFVIKQDKANKAFNSYDYATALGYLKELSDYFPQDSTLALNTAIACQNLRNYNQALIYYNRAIETGSSNPVIYQHLAEIYSSKFDTENAIKVLETGQKRNPGNIFILNDLVNLLLDNERYEKAEKALEDATEIYEGERKFDLIIRYPEDFRGDERAIGKLMIPSISAGKIPLAEISTITKITGPSMIYRDKHQRYGAIKFSIRGRDMGSVIDEAQAKVKAEITLPDNYTLEWAGDFENQQRAAKRLSQAVPISLLCIFLILFVLFGNIRDSLLVLNNVPFAMVGGILALLAAGINFNISAGIGFIALFGICVQNGVILITRFKTNFETLKHKPEWTIVDALNDGLESRIRPVVMTAMMAAIGLLPAALSTGIGSEASKPLAVVVIGGLITNTLFNLFVYPIVVYWVYRKRNMQAIQS